MNTNKYTLDFWRNYPWEEVPIQPSTFAEFCLPYMNGGKVLDVCCGNGRDSEYFRNNNLQVSSFDFGTLNLEKEISNFSLSGLFNYVYCRFVLHAIPENLEDYVLINSNHILQNEGLFFIEVRSDKGLRPDKLHYRRLINKEILKSKLTNLNFEILFEQEADNLSIYKDENPLLIRIIAKKIGNIKVNSEISFNDWENVKLSINPKLSAHLLLKTKQILDAHKIPFLLVFGTLLGAYRENGFIKHDTDVDIALFFKHIKKVKALIDEGYFAVYGLELIRNNFPTLYSLRYKEDYIDMYFFKQGNTKYICAMYKIPISQISNPPRVINFLGESFNTVNDIELYLTRRYKNWWEPVENKHAKK